MRTFFSCLLSILLLGCVAQSNEAPEEWISYSINYNVTNAGEDYALSIVDNWKAYLDDPRNYGQENPYWSSREYARSDYSIINMLFYLYQARQAGRHVKCSILGVQPREDGVYQLKTMYLEVNETLGDITLSFVVSAYARKVDGDYKFFGATEYCKGKYEVRKVDSIEYVIHPEHDFQLAEAEKMAAFNQEIAEKFRTEPLAFDYVVANNTNDLGVFTGLEFHQYSMRPLPSGGMADNRNNVLYAGNNSAYYPHELVHLYTHAGFARQHHAWVDEGIAAYFGGSTGYYIEWHWQKLKDFLAANPDYPLEDLSKLQKDIPNGEYTTDFRYAIGGYLMHLVYEEEGMNGLFDALASGRSEEEYFAMLREKLGVDRAGFEDFIRAEMAELPAMSPTEMAQLKY